MARHNAVGIERAGDGGVFFYGYFIGGEHAGNGCIVVYEQVSAVQRAAYCGISDTIKAGRRFTGIISDSECLRLIECDIYRAIVSDGRNNIGV